MNRVSFAFLVFGVAIITFICSCSKKDNNTSTVTPVADKTKLNSLFAAFRSTPQTFVVTAGTSQMVIGAKGTKLRFYPGSFKDENGNVITGGNIDLQLIEMYKPGDMIANRATTMTADGNFLESGGQIYLKASMNGKTVNAGKYGISYANAKSASVMALYPGGTVNEDSVVTWGNPLATVGTFCVTGTVDTITTGLFYKFDSCTTFGWVNCDRFYSSTSPRTKICVTTKDTTLNFTNTQVFMVVPSVNSILTLSDYDRSLHRFQFYEGSTLPEGLGVRFIVMAAKNGTYYYFESPSQLVTTNIVVDASAISAQSIDFIKERLSSL